MSTEEFPNCPNCLGPLDGAPIPQQSLHYYGGATHFRREIGVEIEGVYDGVLFWVCPDCHHAWPRFTHEDFRAAESQRYVEQHNRDVAREVQEMEESA